MVWFAVDKDGSEYIYDNKPERIDSYWGIQESKIGEPIGVLILLPKGTIKKIIGKELTWDDEPVYIK